MGAYLYSRPPDAVQNPDVPLLAALHRIAAMSGLRVGFGAAPEALVRFAFGAADGEALQVACPRLAGPAEPESWSEVPPSAAGFSVVTVEVEEAASGGIEAASAEAYRRLLGTVRPSSHPYLLRIWNYLGTINQGDGDGERYRRFCVGRAAAADAPFNAPPPAATAIGTPQATGAVQVIALCTRTPGIALENPRQTPAWQYPREYGPVSPGFSRGALVGAGDGLRLLASGTASIVGHVSQHPGDAAAQLRESLLNLEALLAEGARHAGGRRFDVAGCEALRIYLRDPADLPALRAGLHGALDESRVLFLHGDICRRELLVELEGVFAPA
jgi:chorismate lyase/3-hydroxybenzoate synthase